MSMLKEFKEFAMRGNVVDLAVGIIIGGAFGKIISLTTSSLFQRNYLSVMSRNKFHLAD